ncbi:MAG TPA: Na-translocating system protein MpsC family protein [Rubrobacter sp.]|nr:Na-translocating system protein MpsC family protein [Rubrobacter sp.]
MLARISTELVQLHSRHYGKGPTKAKTHLVDDTVLCLLRGGFTTIERTLIGTGEQESVLQMRRSFQQVMEDQFRNIVEEATGRKVIAYMSMVHTDPDLAAELFILEPLDESEIVVGASGDGAKPEP